ncbi:hypothetical protein ES703_45631 [subsurface metagenome]
MSHRSHQRGMTLLELIIATAITAVIVGGLSTAIYLIISTTERGNAEASALHNIQKAAYWISRDAQMARTTDLIDGESAIDSLSLQWIDGDGNPHSSSYELSGTELLRNYDDTLTIVARGISSAEFAISGNILTFNIESTHAGRWPVSRATTGKVYLRAKTGE